MSQSETPDNYLGIPDRFTRYQNAAYVLHSIPFDKACSWQRGASLGPRAVIEASKQVEFYDIETDSEPYTAGIYTAPPTEAETSTEMVAVGERVVAQSLSDGKFVFTLGGDHSISLGPIKAHLAHYPSMSILHLDAHADRRQEYDGNRFSHASIIARAQEIVPRIVSVGIRSADRAELKGVNKSDIFFAHQLDHREVWLPQVMSRLGDDVYVTLDVDVFDIGLMPSTGTPEPGGMGWYDVMAVLREVIQTRRLVGMDVVELAPMERQHAPDFLVAKLLYKVMAYREASKTLGAKPIQKRAHGSE